MVTDSTLVASKQGDLIALESLNPTGEEIDELGANCVHYAARAGNLDVLDYLINKCHLKGDKKSDIGATPAHDATASGHLESLVWLLSHGSCNIDDKDSTGSTIVHLAARFGQVRVLRWLLENTKCSVLEKALTGALPIHFAAANGNIECVKMLLAEAPGSVNMQMSNGATPVYLASQEGNLEVLHYLTENARGSPKIRSFDGMSCVHAAAQSGQLDCVKYLVEDQGCDANDRDFDGVTPLHFAASRGYPDIVDWLMKHGSRVMLDNIGGSPLHDAAENGQTECVRVLMQRGCDAQIQDNNGATALDLAHQSNNEQCAAAITAHQNGKPFDIPPVPQVPRKDTPRLRRTPFSSVPGGEVLNNGGLGTTDSDTVYHGHLDLDAVAQSASPQCDILVRRGVLWCKEHETGECVKHSNNLSPVTKSPPPVAIPQESISQSQDSPLSSTTSTLSDLPDIQPTVSSARAKFEKATSYSPPRSTSSSAPSSPKKSVLDRYQPGKQPRDSPEAVTMATQTEELPVVNGEANNNETKNAAPAPPPPPAPAPPGPPPGLLLQLRNHDNESRLSRPNSFSSVDSAKQGGGWNSKRSSLSSGATSPNPASFDLIAELKASKGAGSLKRAQKIGQPGMLSFSSSSSEASGPTSNDVSASSRNNDVIESKPLSNGTVSPRPVQNGTVVNVKDNEPNTTQTSGLKTTIAVSSSKPTPSAGSGSDKTITKVPQTNTKPPPPGSFNARDFLDQVPTVDAGGKEIPAWKRQMMAKTMAEKAKVEAEVRKKVSK
ncbi:unnamed protein product [Owenia fusiformis]|uniref:Espin n=1 Tax=Owenia fusiformis TaxID=6347 RepID=A0A8S4N3S9_OWEFU|nr:unnamed protein product [Owenia fusiformis]